MCGVCTYSWEKNLVKRKEVIIMNYNYLKNLEADIIMYIKDNKNIEDLQKDDDLFDTLYDELWAEDSVTGNGSGSYTFNAAQAEQNLAGNLGLLADCLTEFGHDVEILRNPEACDVLIRCFLLGEALQNVITEIRG